jgi:O-acetyl-ADP-ribose deacetylase (regulator of RNase III)
MGQVCSHKSEPELQQVPQQSLSKVYKGVTFINEIGDICECQVDAIFNAANYQLQNNAGLAQSLAERGGPLIQQECDKIMADKHNESGIESGRAEMTSAGKLKAKHIIHVICPMWAGGEYEEEIKLKEGMLSGLALAVENKLTSIAIPSVSSGVFGFPRDASAHLIVVTCVEFINSCPDNTITSIKFVNHDSNTSQVYTKEIEIIAPLKEQQETSARNNILDGEAEKVVQIDA